VFRVSQETNIDVYGLWIQTQGFNSHNDTLKTTDGAVIGGFKAKSLVHQWDHIYKVHTHISGTYTFMFVHIKQGFS